MRRMTSMKWRISAATVLVAALALLGGIASDAQQVGSLQITQTVEPQQFYVKGSGIADEEAAEVRLQLRTPELPDRLPTDLMLVVDRSASFPIDQASRAAKRLINMLDPSDRVGLVSFATEATVDAPLTPASDAQRVRHALDDLLAEGKTGLGAGIAVAADELDFDGRDNAERVAVVFTDGRSNFGRDPVEAALTAAEDDVTIYTVGIGEFPNRSLMTDIAEATGGRFFETYTDSIAQTIFEGSLSGDMPFARDVEVVTTINEEFAFERALRNPPTEFSQHPDGATEVRWRRSELEPDATWDLRFEVSADEDGTFALYNSTAYVRYTNIQGREVEQDLPNVQLTVRPTPPKASANFRFSPQTPTRFDTVRFTDTSSVESGGRLVDWDWSFGDGATSSLQNPTHEYQDDGIYRVELTVTTDQGVEDTITKTIEVSTQPQVIDPDFEVSPDDPTRFDEIQFSDESTVDPRGRITRWHWDFDDGSTSSLQDPTHQYDEDGTYRVRLTVTTDEGNEATLARTIEVSTPPQVVDPDFSFTPTNPSRIDEIEFTDETSVSPRGEVTDWRWDFGDGATSTEANPTHQYDEDGTYRVRLEVTTDEDNEATFTRTIEVSTPPVRATRSIDTYTPTDQTLPTRSFRVTVELQVNVTVHGLGLDENAPEDWEVTPVENSTGQLRSDDLQWLFSEQLEPGARRTIVYDVTVPEFANPGTFQLDGTLSSASPELAVAVEGDTQMEVVAGFAIPVVIAHWDTNNKKLDLKAFPAHTINKNQILQAIAWWQEGTNVPNTEDAAGNKKAIDFATIQQLVSYWLTDTSVFDDLPEADVQADGDDEDDGDDAE